MTLLVDKLYKLIEKKRKKSFEKTKFLIKNPCFGP
jgi:hypothetical protein